MSDLALKRDLVLAPVTRWTAEKKLALLRAIEAGVISLAEARAAHRLSADEIEEWRSAYRRGGARALKQVRA